MFSSTAALLAEVRRQLAKDMNCREEDFRRDGTVFCEAALHPERRLFDRQQPYAEAATMGNGIVVSAEAAILPRLKTALKDLSRDDLFASPWFSGHSLYYLPDCRILRPLPCPAGFRLHWAEGSSIVQLYRHPGFHNAIQYDRNHPRPDTLVIYADNADGIAGMAGASADSATMWQIGIDVEPRHRRSGLAGCLVSRLAAAILERDIVPYYGTASSNIPSQATAHRSGFRPAWMCTYRNTLT
ncbi:GNAT family N-acetyltransferase [Victivallis sp. Marseille-Q1083]|uniref:GNAT family N-acetyltransferase n=1 Tax=Victivallis sp. Marseille-Q1083 TaxID=2717288 RepID=UPI00158E8D2E|nr:GNAT family N-acetyltransferase [Victivallis sp. Marseille-Q1083]